MNLPENLSPDAARLYELIAAEPSGQPLSRLSEVFNGQPATEGSPKAIATANSLLVKGMVRKAEDGGNEVYTVPTPPAEGSSNEDKAEESYTEGEGSTATGNVNAEEQRMLDLIQKNDGQLSEAELFDQYDKEQQPQTDDASEDNNKLEAALKELTEAGVISQEGDSYSTKK